MTTVVYESKGRVPLLISVNCTNTKSSSIGAMKMRLSSPRFQSFLDALPTAIRNVRHWIM